MASQKSDNGFETEKTLRRLNWMVVAGLFGVLVFALQSGKSSEVVSIASVGVMVAGASLLAGVMLGFLFGIPRTPPERRPSEESTRQAKEKAPATQEQTPAYKPNTNLEEISDWLTKILVGVGLTQISAIAPKMQGLAAYLATGLGGADTGQIFALATLIYFVACGFLNGWLWTRLYLPRAFRQADLETALAQAREAREQVGTMQQQQRIDAEALTLTLTQLNAAADLPYVPQSELDTKIKDASPPVKVQIFYHAQRVRSENWREPRNKPRMERTIPIFRALIASDPDERFHPNHGQLGFALKDKLQPEWAEAERELTKAIEIRDRLQERSWRFYEFNRATCRIMLDTAFHQDTQSDRGTRDRIYEDLRAAYQTELKNLLEGDPTIGKWMELNKIRPKDLA